MLGSASLMARAFMQAAANFAKGTHDHYLRVKRDNGSTVLLDVTVVGNFLMGGEVTVRDGDIGLAVYGVIRNEMEQVHFMDWDDIVWVKVVEFDWYEGKLREVAV